MEKNGSAKNCIWFFSVRANQISIKAQPICYQLRYQWICLCIWLGAARLQTNNGQSILRTFDEIPICQKARRRITSREKGVTALYYSTCILSHLFSAFSFVHTPLLIELIITGITAAIRWTNSFWKSMTHFIFGQTANSITKCIPFKMVPCSSCSLQHSWQDGEQTNLNCMIVWKVVAMSIHILLTLYSIESIEWCFGCCAAELIGTNFVLLLFNCAMTFMFDDCILMIRAPIIRHAFTAH